MVAPKKDAKLKTRKTALLKSGLNPRICKRCDLLVALLLLYSKTDVSIHASVKDATGIAKKLLHSGKFQSTHL